MSHCRCSSVFYRKIWPDFGFSIVDFKQVNAWTNRVIDFSLEIFWWFQNWFSYAYNILTILYTFLCHCFNQTEMTEIENNNNKKKQEKIPNEEIKPNDASASKLLSFFSKIWTAYNTIILRSRFPQVNINLRSKVQEI